jgi:hypothetical protein
VRWIQTGPSEVDVLRFRDAIAAGDLELAARLYSGDLLPACYDDWVLAERAKLRAEACRVLVRLTDEAAGRYAHLSGKLAKALMAKAPELLADPPKIEKADVLADRLLG